MKFTSALFASNKRRIAGNILELRGDVNASSKGRANLQRNSKIDDPVLWPCTTMTTTRFGRNIFNFYFSLHPQSRLIFW